MISFRLDGRSVVPPYLQIVQQVRQALRMGVLDVGDQLPTVREVVAATAINPNTVLKAYRDLEREGLVEPRAGHGTFVLRRPPGPPPCRQRPRRRSRDGSPGSSRSRDPDPRAVEALSQGPRPQRLHHHRPRGPDIRADRPERRRQDNAAAIARRAG